MHEIAFWLESLETAEDIDKQGIILVSQNVQLLNYKVLS